MKDSQIGEIKTTINEDEHLANSIEKPSLYQKKNSEAINLIDATPLTK